MLVLTRCEQEAIMIGDDIEIRVLVVDRGSVKLGITAPPEVHILRTELTPHESDEAER